MADLSRFTAYVADCEKERDPKAQTPRFFALATIDVDADSHVCGVTLDMRSDSSGSAEPLTRAAMPSG